jgi:general secretion pathway protein H
MAPISAIGERGSERGFTLVEVLVVLLILSLATSFVLVTLPDARPSLTVEAERFAARLQRAREEAIFTNRTVEIRITAEGYGFDVRQAGERVPLATLPFEDTLWTEDTTALLQGADSSSRIGFDSTGFATPARVDLFRADGHVRVVLEPSGKVRIDDAR